MAYPRSWPSLGWKLNCLGTKFGPPGLGRPSEGKKCSGYKVCPTVLALPGMGKNCLGTKFGPPGRLGTPSDGKYFVGYQVWPTPGLVSDGKTIFGYQVGPPPGLGRPSEEKK